MTTLDIILLVLLALAVAAAAYFFLTRRRAAAKAVAVYGDDLKRQIKQSEEEALRYKILYTDAASAAEMQTMETIGQSDIPIEDILKNAERIIIEQEKLESEKAEIAQRNRKLWDMSLSIQKEKERIAVLKKDIEEKHRSVTDSIQYAQRIQLAVLPSKKILQRCFSDYFLFWRPRDIVSGDFYWMKQCGDVIAFTIADCTGHGVPGSFMSLLGVTFLNDICNAIDEDTMPSDILESLRADIISALNQDSSGKPTDDGMDIAFCILNLKTMKLRFAGANNPMYLVRKGELQEFRPVKNPIGNYNFVRDFKTEEVEVQEGDWVYMFSDGFPDQFGGPENRKLTSRRFKELIADVSQYSGDEQSRRLGEFLTEWRGEYPQLDDVLVGGYRILPQPS